MENASQNACQNALQTEHRSTLPIRVDWLKSPSAAIAVLRDDLLPGGTKQRACLPYLTQKGVDGALGFVYASPFCGFAQVALAQSAALLKVPCVIFCEEDKSQEMAHQKHAFSVLAERWGAHVHVVSSLDLAESAASEFANGNGFTKLPLGFNDPIFNMYFQRAVGAIWRKIAALSQQQIKRVWLPVGSGTLARCVRAATPKDVELVLIDVGVLPETDARILSVRALENSSYQKLQIGFHEPAPMRTPVPSNLHYDAKLWPSIQKQGQPGDLWWNVAR